MINGNAVGGITGYGKTFILTDENGNELTGVVVGEETIFTADASDIKIGKIAAIDSGVVEGTDTKTYRTEQGSQLILQGESFSLVLDLYDQYSYTKFQCIIAQFNTSFEDSVCAEKISLNNCVYNTNSVEEVSVVTKNIENRSIDLNIVNDTEHMYVVHFITYKEE